MYANIYQPPLKRQRLLPSSSEVKPHRLCELQHNALRHANVDDHISDFIPHHSLSSNHTSDETVTEFKSQLKEIFEIFPPLTQLIASQMNPHQSFQELYQIFTASSSDTCTIATSSTTSVSTDTISSPSLTSPPSNDCIPNVTNPMELAPINANQSANDTATVSTIDITAMLTEAKEKTIKHAHRNMEVRCNKIAQSLNKTTKSKYGAFLHYFAINEAAKTQILNYIAHGIRSWKGAKLGLIKNHEQAFKVVRAHWNRQKAQLLGDILFCLILANLFKISLQVVKLTHKQRMLFYIDLFRGLLSTTVQFERSMPRPVILNASFGKAMMFKKLTENLLQSFSGGAISMVSLRNYDLYDEYNSSHRARTTATFYDECLERVQLMITNASNEGIQYSIQSHFACIKTACNFSLNLIEWKTVQLSPALRRQLCTCNCKKI